MLKKTITSLLSARHPWRVVNFDELGELYVSMMFRNLAISLIGVFVPIYLYQLGIGLQTILLFYATIFGFRVVWDFVCAFIVARIGPKHTMAISYALQIVMLSLLVSLDRYNLPLWLIALFAAMSSGLFFISYHVDFSKIKHSKHGGKELGFMVFMERLGTVIGPIIGGILATIFDVKYSFFAAITFFLIGIIPMFMSGEPVKTKQIIHFRDLPIRRIRRDLITYSALGVENNVCLVIWPLFIATFVLVGSVYLKIGIITALGALMTVTAARIIGKLIDEHKGRSLLRISLIGNIMLHMARIFTNSFGYALGLNVTNEVITVGYRMSYVKGMYDKADDLPGFRIAYISTMEAFASSAKSLFYVLLAVLCFIINDKNIMVSAFLIAILMSLVIMLERFPALNSRGAR